MPIRKHPEHLLITHDRLLALVEYHPGDGQFTWRVARNSHARRVRPGDPVTGNVDRHGYLMIGLDRRRYQASRLAWFYVHEVWPAGEVDHKNRDTLNNRIDNLRDAPKRDLQRANQKVRKDSKSGVKGVNWNRRRNLWRARCKQRTIGHFMTAEAAHAAYLAVAKREFGEFTRSR